VTLIKGVLGAGAGFVAWYFVWFVNPLGIFGAFPYHYEQGAIVIDDIFGLSGMIISFFVIPVGGAYIATQS
jgi:hypothetical protein